MEDVILEGFDPPAGDAHSDVPPDEAEGAHVAKATTATLEEMNAKLDAILAALGGKEA